MFSQIGQIWWISDNVWKNPWTLQNFLAVCVLIHHREIIPKICNIFLQCMYEVCTNVLEGYYTWTLQYFLTVCFLLDSTLQYFLTVCVLLDHRYTELSRVGNSLICSKLLILMSDCDRIAQVPHDKRAPVRDSLRLLMIKEWMSKLLIFLCKSLVF